MSLLKYCLLLFLIVTSKVLACSPALPVTIPPLSPDGEFQYIYYDYQKDLESSVRKAENVAVVKLHSDSLSESKGGQTTAIAILELLHGWGYQSGRYMKYIRNETSCGEPEKITGSGWFVALLNRNKVYAVIPYGTVKEQVKSRGEPEYVYSSLGLLKSPHNNHGQ